MKHLTTAENIKSESERFVSKSLDDGRIIPIIEECENIHIKNQIGNTLFVDLLDYVNASEEDQKTKFADYKPLLEGCTYEYKDCAGRTNMRSIVGLTKALNYYVWASLVYNNQYTITRFGVTRKKDNENSQHVDISEVDRLNRSTLSIADQYLNDCVLYLKNNREKYPLFNKSYSRNRYDIIVIK